MCACTCVYAFAYMHVVYICICVCMLCVCMRHTCGHMDAYKPVVSSKGNIYTVCASTHVIMCMCTAHMQGRVYVRVCCVYVYVCACVCIHAWTHTPRAFSSCLSLREQWLNTFPWPAWRSTYWERVPSTAARLAEPRSVVISPPGRASACGHQPTWPSLRAQSSLNPAAGDRMITNFSGETWAKMG